MLMEGLDGFAIRECSWVTTKFVLKMCYVFFVITQKLLFIWYLITVKFLRRQHAMYRYILYNLLGIINIFHVQHCVTDSRIMNAKYLERLGLHAPVPSSM